MIRLHNYLHKIVQYQQNHGTVPLLRVCLKNLGKTLFSYNKEVVGCIKINESSFHANPKITVTVRAARTSDIPELTTITAGYKKRDFAQWIRDQYIVYIAQIQKYQTNDGVASVKEDTALHHFVPFPNQSSVKTSAAESDEKIIGYICACPAKKSTHAIVSLLRLKETDYWAVDSFIHPAYRGKGINSAIASGFLAQAYREGYTRGYGTIAYHNNASRKSYAAIGEKEIGILKNITILGCTFHFFKRDAGYEEYFD